VGSDFSKQGKAYGAGRLKSVHEKHSVPYGNVGYPAGPYQSKRGLHSVNSGYPQGAQSEVGSGTQPKAIKSRSGKMKTNLDIFNARTLHEAGLTKL
jgi:hypothetical protein